jgi:LmbE family N-acetylglucosaminyl deacetylase
MGARRSSPAPGLAGRSRHSVLVLVAHPDDEALGFAGVIARCRSEGRRVRVAVMTNGESTGRGRIPFGRCGAPWGAPARIARLGTCRNRETVDAMRLLGLRWSRDVQQSDVFFLGYPNNGLELIAGSDEPWRGDGSGLHRTYALGRGSRRCDGDLRFLVDGRHSSLRASDLAADVSTLLELTRPSDVYTHVEFDGHPDHAETRRQLIAALRRAGLRTTVHGTLIHPAGSGGRMYESALEWPNPAQQLVSSPFDRFTPDLAFEPPPAAAGGSHPEGSAWGPSGEPDDLVETPLEMRHPDPPSNLKWQVISRYRSQISCRPGHDGEYHASCGYMRAFVKRYEFFWTYRVE